MECTKCSQKVNSKEELKIHHETKHKGIICSVCNKICVTEKSLRKHGYQHVQQSYHCEICDRYFTFPGELDGHMIIHDTTKQFSCNNVGCKRSYFRKSKLNAHILTHNSKIWKCEYPDCAYKAIDKQYLKAHKKGHSDKLRYPCEHCPEKFKHFEQRRRHDGHEHEGK